MNGEEYLSKKSKSEYSATVVAQSYVILLESSPKVLVHDNISKEVPHILAKVKWFEPHPSSFHFCPSVLVVASTFCEPISATFISISRISP